MPGPRACDAGSTPIRQHAPMAVPCPTDPARESPSARDRRELTAELLSMVTRGQNRALRPEPSGGLPLERLCLGSLMEPRGNGWQNRHTVLGADGNPRWTLHFERAHGVIRLRGVSHRFRHVVRVRFAGTRSADVRVETEWNAAPAPVEPPDTVLEHAHRRARAEGRTLDLRARRRGLLARLLGR